MIHSLISLWQIATVQYGAVGLFAPFAIVFVALGTVGWILERNS